METLILIVHVLLAMAMIGLIMLQQGKGAEMGASFGAGASQTVFGSAGSAGFLTKLTASLALLFFVTSITLAVFAKQHSKVTPSFVPASVTAAPAKSTTDVPVTSSTPASAPTTATAPAPVTATPAPAVPVAAQTAVAPTTNNDVPTTPATGASNPTQNPVK